MTGIFEEDPEIDSSPTFCRVSYNYVPAYVDGAFECVVQGAVVVNPENSSFVLSDSYAGDNVNLGTFSACFTPVRLLNADPVDIEACGIFLGCDATLSP